MKIFFSKFNLVAGLLFCMLYSLSMQNAIAEYEPGEHYEVVSSYDRYVGKGNKVEIVEFFLYTCPHCKTFEGYLDGWVQALPENVEFIRVPVVWGSAHEPYAAGYYALMRLNDSETLHKAVFTGTIVERRNLGSKKNFSEYLSALGVDVAKFNSWYSSIATITKVNLAKKLTRDWRVSGTPSLFVNGKYRVLGSSYTEMLDIAYSLATTEG